MCDYQQISVNHHKFNYELDPDLIFNFDHNVIEYVYTDVNRTRETNDTITLKALNSLDSPKLHKIESVLCCKTNQDPYLLIICSDHNNNNYMFCHNVKTKSSKVVEFNKPITGEITHADMTCSPFRVAYVDRLGTIDTKPSFAMVIGTKNDDATLILLTLDSSQDQMNVELTESFTTNSKDKQDIGHVTAICILTADKGDRRMGHSDPQILLGFSQGAILIYRIRASVYSYKASRIRVPVDLSDFTEFPGYPITQLSCARSYNSLLMNVALAQEKPQEIKYQYRQSYIKLVETRGDFTRRQRAIINPPESIQSSAKILETKLIPSTTTLADSTLQLSIIFQNGDKSYDLNIWEISPTKINQALTLAMDQQSCVDTMANSDTVKSLKLDSNGYLMHVPQKIADIILEENEDDDTNQPADTNSTAHSVVNDNSEIVMDTHTVDNTTNLGDDKEAVLSKDINKSTTNMEQYQAIADQNIQSRNLEDVSDRADVSASTENALKNQDTLMTDEIEDLSDINNSNNNNNISKREGEHLADVEISVKRQKTIALNEDDEENLTTSFDKSPTFVTKEESHTSISFSMYREQDDLKQVVDSVTGIVGEQHEKPEVTENVVSDEQHEKLAVTEEKNIVLDEQHQKATITEEENIVLVEQKEISREVVALDDDYVVIEHKDAIQDTEEVDSFKEEHHAADFSLPSSILAQEITEDASNRDIKNDLIETLMDEDTLVDASFQTEDDSTSDITTGQQEEENKAADIPTIIQDNHIIPDNTASLENVQSAHEVCVISVEQTNEEENEENMIPYQSREIQMQDDGENPENHSIHDNDTYMIYESGPDYADEADNAGTMFNQEAYDTFEKEGQNATMIISSSEDELKDSQNEEEDKLLDASSSSRQIVNDKDGNFREGSYLEESDEVQSRDTLEKDPIEDKNLHNKEDSIKFVSGGELADVNEISSNNTPQQIPIHQQQSANTAIDYIPVSTEALSRLLNNEQETVSDSVDINEYATPPQFAVSEPELVEPKTESEPEPEVIDDNLIAYNNMLDYCFGSTQIDLDSISQVEIDEMGDYCWHSNNIQLKIFMLKYCQLHQMHNEGYLLAKKLLQRERKGMTNEEIKECITLKKSLKVDNSIKFGDLLNPFNYTARQKLLQQEQDFHKPQIPVDFYKSEQGQMYLDYYNIGRV